MEDPTSSELDAVRKSGYRPQVVLCFVYEEKLLFVYKEEYDLWQLPQGGIQNEESIPDAIRREAIEELGKDFLHEWDGSYTLLGEDQVTFPPDKQGTRELKTDDGKDVTMLGKTYYAFGISIPSSVLDIEETDFDDSAWMNYENGKRLADSIYQKGKRRVTHQAIELLKEAGFISSFDKTKRAL